MLIIYISARLRAPWCRSLKDKRAVVKPLLTRLKQTFNVSAVEADSQDAHTLITLGIAALAFDAGQADSIQENLYRFIEGASEAEIIAWEAEFR